jgi:hypothetical protein
MMALPVAFLPFDPTCDYDESNNEVDESCSASDDEDESIGSPLHDSITNGDKNHQRKQNLHIGGGVILVSKTLSLYKINILPKKGSASECILVAMLAARTKKITMKRQADPLIEDGQILARLVCYTSKLV